MLSHSPIVLGSVLSREVLGRGLKTNIPVSLVLELLYVRSKWRKRERANKRWTYGWVDELERESENLVDNQAAFPSPCTYIIDTTTSDFGGKAVRP